MTGHGVENAVVVGVDGSAEGWHALRWAASRAEKTRRPLHVMHAEGALASEYSLGPERDPLDNICDEALDMVAHHHPDLPVTWSQPSDAPVSALVKASARATEIVLGTKGTGAVRGAVLGSVVTQVSAAAQCPVLVVRAAVTDRHADGPVVVGVDLRPDGQAALDFAFEEAARLSVPLVAVRCWQLDRWDFASGIPMPGGNMKAAHQYHRDRLQQALTGPSGRHPKVQVTAQTVCAPTVGALVEHSENGSLLVVGTRGHHEIAGLVLGSVSQGVVRRASCPVAVVAHTPAEHAAASRQTTQTPV